MSKNDRRTEIAIKLAQGILSGQDMYIRAYTLESFQVFSKHLVEMSYKLADDFLKYEQKLEKDESDPTIQDAS